MSLARRIVDAIGVDAEHMGPRLARDLQNKFYLEDGKVVATEKKIQDLLDSLASPLIGAIQGDPDNGYVLACRPDVTAHRLRRLGEALTADADS